jgi:hypothetical protein
MPESKASSGSEASAADFELARAALLDITTAETIGEPAGSIDEGDGVISVYFDTTMAGYKGWRWTVSIAHIEGADATVLETEMTPGETALLSPAWVPWADRLADYKAGQDEQSSDDDDSDDDEDDDDDDDDFDDDDVNDDDDALLHSGDLDGVDIDSLEDEESEDSEDGADDDESAPTVNVEQPEETEHESDDAGVKKARVSRSKKKNGDQAH